MLYGHFQVNRPVGTGHSRPNDVKRLRRALNETGHASSPPNPSGQYDANAIAAIERFQRDFGLKQDGIVLPGGPTERVIELALAAKHEGGPAGMAHLRKAFALLSGAGLTFRATDRDDSRPGVFLDHGGGVVPEERLRSILESQVEGRPGARPGEVKLAALRPALPNVLTGRTGGASALRHEIALQHGGADELGDLPRHPLSVSRRTFGNSDKRQDSKSANAFSGLSSGTRGAPPNATGSIMPAPLLTSEGRATFERKTGLRLVEAKDGFALIDPETGDRIAELPEDVAAELVRNVAAFSDRLALLRLFARRDLTSDEKRALAAQVLPEVDPRTFGIEEAPSPIMRRAAYQRYQRQHSKVEEARRAFHEALAALDHDREIPMTEALDRLQRSVFPELYDQGRTLRTVILDVAPGTGNLRSYGHFENDITRIGEALDARDLTGTAAGLTMATLDAIGIVPGGNVLRTLGRGARNAVPYADGVFAERELGRMARQASTQKPLDMRHLFGAAYDGLPDNVKKRLAFETRKIYGRQGERYVGNLAGKVDPHAAEQVRIVIPGNRQRILDLSMRKLSQVVLDDLKAGYARFIGRVPPAPSPGHFIEVKTAGSYKKKRQREIDAWLNLHRDEAAQLGAQGVHDLRVFPEQIPIQFMIEDAVVRFGKMVDAGFWSRRDADLVLSALEKQLQSGIKAVPAKYYVNLLARIAATSVRNFEASDPADIPEQVLVSP